MKKLSSSTIVAVLAMLIFLNCGSDTALNGSNSPFTVNYEVNFLSQGAVKVSHRDNDGNLVTEDPMTSNWERTITADKKSTLSLTRP